MCCAGLARRCASPARRRPPSGTVARSAKSPRREAPDSLYRRKSPAYPSMRVTTNTGHTGWRIASRMGLVLLVTGMWRNSSRPQVARPFVDEPSLGEVTGVGLVCHGGSSRCARCRDRPSGRPGGASARESSSAGAAAERRAQGAGAGGSHSRDGQEGNTGVVAGDDAGRSAALRAHIGERPKTEIVCLLQRGGDLRLALARRRIRLFAFLAAERS